MKLLCKFFGTKNCRKTLMTYVFVGQILRFLSGLLLVSVGAFIRISIGTRMSFLARHYNGITVPAILIASGAAMTVESIAAIKFCFRYVDTENDLSKCEAMSKSCFCYFIISCLVLLLTVVSVVVLFYELQIIHYAFKRGIEEAMESYKNDITVKEEFDVLQMKYGCCGLESYKDWFRVKWINEKYLTNDRRNKIKKSNKYFIDDVPFSCCDKTLMLPCISEGVLDEKSHYRYSYKTNLTLYKRGCLETLWQFYGKQTFMKVSVILVIVICFQISIAITARLLQTSALSIRNGDDPPAGWIISSNSGDSGTIIVKDFDGDIWT